MLSHILLQLLVYLLHYGGELLSLLVELLLDDVVDVHLESYEART